MKSKPETDQDVLDALAALLEHEDPDDSLEDVYEDLRAAGLDPEAVGSRIADVAADAYRQSPYNWRQRARSERAEALRQLGSRTATSRRRAELLARINAIVERSQMAQTRVQAHFRNFESASDQDLADLLAELEFLADQDEDGSR